MNARDPWSDGRGGGAKILASQFRVYARGKRCGEANEGVFLSERIKTNSNHSAHDWRCYQFPFLLRQSSAPILACSQPSILFKPAHRGSRDYLDASAKKA